MFASVVYPAPCEFAQTPTYGDCDGVNGLSYQKSTIWEVPFDGVNMLALAYFKGNLGGCDKNYYLYVL
jgi:hypothetical protein